MRFKNLKDLCKRMKQIDEQLPKINGTFFIGIDVISYMTKIPGFQLGLEYEDVVKTGQGKVGKYKRADVWVSPLVPKDTVYFLEKGKQEFKEQ